VARVARAFNHMAADLAVSDRTRRLLLADVSHELMTPLTAVRGYQERLIGDPVVRESTRLSHYAAVIGDEALRVERIVGDLLDLAKLEGGGDSLDLQDVSVEGLFGRVAARQAPLAAAKALTFVTGIAPGAEIAFGDKFRLEQALQNLAANAVRHAPRGGHVELQAEQSDNGTALRVTDDGPGIAPEHLAFVFDRFYKVFTIWLPAESRSQR
jgi:signal transduction histidine kinase